MRAELAATTDRPRQGRLLMQVAELEERIGDEPAAARDYLAAFNADPAFREPLEALVRLLEKRRSVKNLGKLIDAMVRAATAPEEKVRALLMQATYQADVTEDLVEAKRSAFEATAVEGAPAQELSSAWLVAEVIAGRAGDPEGRTAALAERSKHAAQPEWRALLLMDRARVAAAAGQVDEATALLKEARSLESAATFAATALLESITRDAAGGPEGRGRAEALAEAIEEGAALAEQAALGDTLGDSLGVPRWARATPRLVDAWLSAADARERLGQLDRAAWTLDHALAFFRRGDGERDPLAEGALVTARMRVAGRAGDTELAAKLAEERLAGEKDGAIAAALAIRVAEHAIAQKDAPRALRALSQAVAGDPGMHPREGDAARSPRRGGRPGAARGAARSVRRAAGDRRGARADLRPRGVRVGSAREGRGGREGGALASGDVRGGAVDHGATRAHARRHRGGRRQVRRIDQASAGGGGGRAGSADARGRAHSAPPRARRRGRRGEGAPRHGRDGQRRVAREGARGVRRPPTARSGARRPRARGQRTRAAEPSPRSTSWRPPNATTTSRGVFPWSRRCGPSLRGTRLRPARG